jgi:predicted MPP superfamily phosphohydrolase
MGNTDAISEIFNKTSIIALRNQSIEINGLQLVGIDDKSYRGEKKLDEILQESTISDSDQFTILVSHQPQHLSKLE